MLGEWQSGSLQSPAESRSGDVMADPRLITIVERRFTHTEALDAGRWSYPAPYNLYDGSGSEAFLHLPYLPVHARGHLVGFVCFGAEARVVGQLPQVGTVDVGIGIRPDLVGDGLGTLVMREVVTYATRAYSPQRLRAAVAGFNRRSQRLCLTAGFQATRTFDGPGRKPFVELVLYLP